MGETEIGKVTHYFNKLGVAGVKLSGALAVGDTVHILGHTTDLVQSIESIQAEHDSLETAGDGDEIGLKVSEHVREHDTVFKVTDG